MLLVARCQVVRARVKRRAEASGRDVDPKVLEDSMKSMADSLALLTPKVDFVARINNDGGTPSLESFEKVDLSGNWSLIGERFAGTHAQPGDFPDSMAPLIVRPVARRCRWVPGMAPPSPKWHGSDVLAEALQLDDPAAAFDYGRSAPIAVRLGDEAAFHIRKGARRADTGALLEQCRELVLSPAHPVNLTAEAAKIAGIPEEAAAFAWCYPHPQMTYESCRRHGLDFEDPLVCLLSLGAFVYFGSRGAIIGINVVDVPAARPGEDTFAEGGAGGGGGRTSPRGATLDGQEPGGGAAAAAKRPPGAAFRRRLHMVTFAAPESLDADPLLIEDARWQPVTNVTQYLRGARLVAWVKPGERIANTKYGAFAFLFHGLDEPDDERDCFFPVAAAKV